MSREREAKALTRTLAPYRSGWQGKLRAEVRCMLVRLMGFANCDDIPVGIRKIPYQFPGRSGLEPEDMRDMSMVAQDGLLELGYEAAAGMLGYWTRGDIEVAARRALENLESGPPSVMMDGYLIITKSIRRYKVPSGEQLVGRSIGNGWWYRFVRGKPVHNQRGDYVGWDDEAGYTFHRCGRTLEDVLAAQHGSAALS